MKQTFSFILCAFLFSTCGKPGVEQSSEEVLVRVKDRVFTRGDLKSQMPNSNGMSSADSTIRAENIIKKWIIDALMDEAAYQNIGDDKAEIDKLVGEYRRSLMRHLYQEYIIRDKVSAEINEHEQMEYYEENKQQFVLGENLIRGLFIKVPVDAPGLDNVRTWYRSESEESLEKIEKYGIQNAILYDYFYDRWVNFNDIVLKMPHQISNPTQFLRANDHLELSDSTHVYFLNITDKLLIGSMAPFDYVRIQIQEMLVNKRKIDYLHAFGENLYRDAVKKGTVKFITE
ncbi:MAG: peptidyl-prolyl cis-trans isomerase [Tannerella sp.]|jgi:hypothetical protein|nr:peptidyl-prolyl cis-trans isomerase [Tannerella sp.]